MKFTVEIDRSDLSRIRKKARNLDAGLRATDGPVLKYLFKYVADPYAGAVMSGMGTVNVGSIWNDANIKHSLSPFMGTVQTVSWKPLSKSWMAEKAERGLHLSMWMATGATVRGVRPVLKAYTNTYTITSGIDKRTDSEAYLHAINSEFGGTFKTADGRIVSYEGRPLFTMLNEVFVANIDKIRDEVRKAIAQTIEDVGWGK